MVVMSVVLALVGFWLVDLIGRTLAPFLGYTSFTDPAALHAVVMVVLALFGLGDQSVAARDQGRHYERQCDRYALERTQQPDAYRAAFIKLAQLNKSDPDPHPLVAWLFHDHPPIRERLAMADG